MGGCFPAPLRAEAVPTKGGCPMDSPVTVLVPESSLGEGGAPSILLLLGSNRSPGWLMGQGYRRGRSRGNVIIES